MADVQLPGLCLGVPIDHRLEPFLGTGLTSPDPFVGSRGHARAIESFGRRLQKMEKIFLTMRSTLQHGSPCRRQKAVS